MKKITARFIADAIWKGGPKNIPDLSAEVIRIIKRHFQVGELQAFEIGSGLLSGVKKILEKKIEEDKRKDISSKLEFSPYSDNVLSVKDGLLVTRRGKILRDLSKLNWKEFEDVVRRYLKHEGVENVDLIGRTKDGGIDFFGILNLGVIGVDKPLIKRIILRVIGQAKRWKGKIGEGEARKFSTHLEELLHKEGRAWKKLPGWFKGLSCPFIPYFVTNSKFTDDGEKYFEKIGVIWIDGEQFAEALAKIF